MIRKRMEVFDGVLIGGMVWVLYRALWSLL